MAVVTRATTHYPYHVAEMTGIFIGRQAIYDNSLEVHGYELLYRQGHINRAATKGHFDGNRATGSVLVNAFLEMGAQRLVGDSLCFVNLTKGFITGEFPLPLPSDRVVIEVLEDIEPTRAIVAGVRKLKAQGVKIALDDYVHRANNDPLLLVSDYVKIDLRAQDRVETIRLCEMLQPYNLKLLAEKVETMEEYAFCKEIGFDYYQGFFLTRPEVVEGHHIPPHRLGLMRMLSRLVDPDVDLEELEDMVGQDVSLAYKLLCYANSARYAPRMPITEIGQTIMMLGISEVRRIVSLLVMANMDDKPGDLVNQSLIRARMCELLAEKTGASNSSQYYTVGLLSMLDAVAEAPMEKVIENLSLSSELREALLNGEGDLGAALRCVRAFEAGDWEQAQFHDLDSLRLTACYMGGVEYSRSVWGDMEPNEKAA